MTRLSIDDQCACAERVLERLESEIVQACDNAAPASTLAALERDASGLRAILTTLRWLAQDRDGCARLLATTFRRPADA